MTDDALRRRIAIETALDQHATKLAHARVDPDRAAQVLCEIAGHHHDLIAAVAGYKLARPQTVGRPVTTDELYAAALLIRAGAAAELVVRTVESLTQFDHAAGV